MTIGNLVELVARVVGLLALLLTSSVAASERLYRVIDRTDGIPGAVVSDVAQDSDGFLWITTSGGLARWDGVDMRSWGRDEVASLLDWVRVGPSGEVITARDNGRLRRVADTGLADLPGPEATNLDAARDAAFDRDGSLWVIDGVRLLERGPSNDWRVVGADALAGEVPLRLAPACDGGVLVSTSQGGLWRASSDAVERLGSPPGLIVRMLCESEERGDVLLGVRGTDDQRGIWRSSAGRLERIAATSSRPSGMARRGDLTVVSTPTQLWLVERGGAAKSLASTERPDGLGRMTFDREGSLWIGSYRGLVHYPEIETVVWQDDDGLPSRHARGVARTGDAVVASTWGGLGVIDADGARHETHWIGREADLCVDGAGRGWTRLSADYRPRRAGEERDAPLVSIRNGAVELWPIDEGALEFGCFAHPDGSLTISAGRGVYSVEPGGTPRLVARLSAEVAAPMMLTANSTTKTVSYVAWPDSICTFPRDQVDGADVGRTVIEPRCGRVETAGMIHTLLEFEGRLLIGTDRAGLLARDDRGAWHPLTIDAPLPANTVLRLTPAEKGLWITGPGFIWRVIEAAGHRSVAEEINSWHGVPSSSYQSLHEDPDGALWVASLAGVVHVPAHVRRKQGRAPKTMLTAVLVDGSRIDQENLELPFRKNRVEMLFSALSYRATDLLRYRVRLGPADTWTELRQPSVRFADLSPGRYEVQCGASLDGRRWTEHPTTFAFVVLRPWYQQWWAIALFVATLAAFAYVAYRLRLARAIALEQQRMRIAMDLHDELGAGLGSIGILTGLAAEPDTEVDSRLSLSQRASALSGSLSQSLADIVWALRPDTPGLDDLGHHIVGRAGPLFEEGPIEFSADYPAEGAGEEVSLAVRRNVLLIALEALRNAAEHAAARRVKFRLARANGGWTMQIADDGVGVERSTSNGSGLGMTSMQRRAEEIGAELSIVSAPGKGTCVQLTFDPRARGPKR